MGSSERPTARRLTLLLCIALSRRRILRAIVHARATIVAAPAWFIRSRPARQWHGLFAEALVKTFDRFGRYVAAESLTKTIAKFRRNAAL